MEMNLGLNDPPPGTNVEALPTFLFSSQGSEEVISETPQPKDDADLAFFLKCKQNIKPLQKPKKKKSGRGERERQREGGTMTTLHFSYITLVFSFLRVCHTAANF